MKHILIIFALLAFSISIFAHPASEITANYSAKTKMLNISFVHNVKDPQAHYIQGIQVRLNELTIISQVCSAQDSVTGGEIVYKIPNLKKNDVLEIILDCSKGGRKTQKMILN